MDNNSQFKIRREVVAGSLADPFVVETNEGVGADSGANTTDTDTTDTDTTGNDPGTGGDADTTPTDTTKDDEPTTTVTNSEELKKTECSGYCKMYNVLNIGIYGALILFLLAMSYQAVKSVGKVKAST